MSKLLLLKKLSLVIIIGWTLSRLAIEVRNFRKHGTVNWKTTDPLLVIGLLLLATKTWGIEAFRVTSSSMEPTLKPGEIFLAVKRPLWKAPPQVGEIVVLRQEKPKIPDLVKRIAATSGDTLVFNENGILINGKPVWWLNPSTLSEVPVGLSKIVVPPHQAFVLGDNLSYSVDSRYFGPIQENQVIGKATLRVYPLSRWSWL